MQDGSRVGKAGCLDNHPLESDFPVVPSPDEVRHGSGQIAPDRTAQAAGPHQDDLFVHGLDQVVVESRFAEFVDNDRDPSGRGVGKQRVKQGRLASA